MKKLLKNLLNSCSPSGYEEKSQEIIKDFIENLGLKPDYSDKIGNLGCKIGRGPIKVLISGHIDEIAMSVLNIDEQGFITPINMSGCDKKVLPGSQVLIMTETGLIKGVVCKHPLHLEHADKIADKVMDFEYYKISIGCDSKKEVEDMGVYVGCPIIFERNVDVDFGKHKILGNALDDKVGVFITFSILETILGNSEVNSWRDKYTVYFISGVQEESGCRGLKVAANNINPDISIDFDVTFAGDGGFVKKDKYGDISLGKGPVIMYGQDKSVRIAKILKDIAKEKEFMYQTGVARPGGTNTSSIQLFSKNCETMLISIPNLNMHSPNEICDFRDIAIAVELVSSMILEELL